MKKYFKRILPVLLAIAAVFTITASPLTAAEKFTDVPDNEWYAAAVYDLADQGILNGKGDGIFAPMANITRGEFAKILAYASGDDLTAYDNGSHFKDCENHWSRININWAYENQIVKGISETEFAPDAKISRQEMAVMIYRYINYLGATLSQTNEKKAFKDNDAIADWATEAVAAMQQAGIINGYPDGTFGPQGSATRAEAAKMISTMLGDILKTPVSTGTFAEITWELYANGTLTFRGTGALDLREIFTEESLPWDKTKVKAVVIEEGITEIGSRAFASYPALKKVTVPGTVKIIYDYAFYNCTRLAEATLAPGLEVLGDSAFEGTSLTEIIIPDTITDNIYPRTFAYCRELKKVTLPAELKKINAEAFYGCRNLTDIEIPKTVTSVGNSAFRYSGITKVTLGPDLNFLGSHVFGCCPNIEAFEVDPANTYVCSIDGVLFSKDLTELRYFPAKRTGTYKTPATTTVIGEYAFACTSLTRVELNDEITTISDYAFQQSPALEWVNIPKAAEADKIGSYLFAYCPALKEINVDKDNTSPYYSEDGVLFYQVKSEDGSDPTAMLINFPAGKTDTYTIPDNVSIIYNYAFTSCKFKELTIPDSVERIGENAFDECNDLTTLNLGKSVEYITANCIGECPKLEAIHVAEGNSFLTDKDGIVYSKSMKALECYPYNYPTGMLTMPDSVKTIDVYAFKNSNISSIVFSPNLTRIETGAFSGCTALKEANLPESLTNLGGEAFYDCTALTKITLPKSVTKISYTTFHNCKSLSTVIYGGTKEDAEAMKIGADNEYLKNANWIYAE